MTQQPITPPNQFNPAVLRKLKDRLLEFQQEQEGQHQEQADNTLGDRPTP